MECVLPQNGLCFAAKWNAFCRKMEFNYGTKLSYSAVFQLLIRTFELSPEGTFARKNLNIFGFSLAYSYL